MDKYIKRIQSRLAYAGISVSKLECRQAYQSILPDTNWEKPSNDHIDLVVQHIAQQKSLENLGQGLAVELKADISEAVVDQTIEITPVSNPDIWETLQPSTTEPEQEKPEQETANTDSIVPATNHLSIQQQPANTLAGISHVEITAAIAQAIQQTGQQGNDEAIQILTSLANELSADIADTQEMVVALVSTYLGKRQTILSSAIGTLNTLRSAQTESFQGGLNQNFFEQKQKNKHEFLNNVAAMFN